jgi:hypothetical protein
VVARSLLLVTMRVNGPPPDTVREAIDAVPFADSIHGRIRSLDVMVPLQISDDANRAHVIGPAKVKDLLDHLVGRLIRMIVRALPATCEPGFAELAVPVSP